MNESWVNLGGHHINIQKFLDEIKLEQKRNLTNPASISIVLFSSFQVLASIYIVFSPSIQLLFIYLGQYDSFRFAVTEQPGTEKTGTDSQLPNSLGPKRLGPICLLPNRRGTLLLTVTCLLWL